MMEFFYEVTEEKRMSGQRFERSIDDGYLKVSASNVSDACDRLEIDGGLA